MESLMSENSNGQIQKRERGERLIAQDDAVALFDTSQFEHMWRVAEVMSKASLSPQHLQGKPADCMLIVQQAHRWHMDPFALAQCSFVVKGKLGYEGKVIAAVVNSRADLKDRLKYDVTGSGRDCEVTVRGTFEGEDEERTIDATWQEGRKMSPHGAKWDHPGMEAQQLCYYAARKWARLHAPELILGVLSADELFAATAHIGPDYAKNVTPPADNLDALTDQLENKVDLPAHEAPSETGGDIVDADTGEVTEGTPEPATGQHGVFIHHNTIHEQEGFKLDPPEQPQGWIVHLGKRGAPPTFATMEEARAAMAARLDEYVNQKAPAGAIDKLESDNSGLIAQWDQATREQWTAAVNSALDALAA